MLKIAVVTDHFPCSGFPTHGRTSYQTLRILARRANIKVFYPHAKYRTWLKPHNRIYDTLDLTYRLPDVDVSYHNYPAFPLLSRPFNGVFAARTLYPHVRDFAPDIVLSYFLYPHGFAALKIGRALSVPVVAVGVGSDIHSIGDRFSRMYTRKVLRTIDFLVTVSEDLRRRAIEMGAREESSRAIINGCDLSVFHPLNAHEARRRLGIEVDGEAIVYVGRMDVRKGLRELVEASAALHRERANLHTYLVGDGPDKPLIDAVIRNHSAERYVHFVPGCSFDDVAVWMGAADVCTLPSYMEGSPNTVMEALACGRPVVATSVGGIPEIMSDECGRLVPPRDSGALAEALASVLDTSWDSGAISSHWGRSWEMCADEFLQIFDSLLPSSSAIDKIRELSPVNAGRS